MTKKNPKKHNFTWFRVVAIVAMLLGVAALSAAGFWLPKETSVPEVDTYQDVGPEQSLRDADTLFFEEQYSAVISLADTRIEFLEAQGVKDGDDLSNMYFFKARAHAQLQEDVEALLAVDRAIELRATQDHLFLVNAAEVQIVAGDISAGLETLNRALDVANEKKDTENPLILEEITFIEELIIDVESGVPDEA